MRAPTKITKKVKSCHTEHYDKPAQQINAVSLQHAERQDATQEHSPIRLTESADLCFSYGRSKQSRTQQNQPLTLCPANNVSKKLHQKG